ncbi:MAG: hypothetical protein JWO03_1473 [Bacteroidetes bacterium]|nr:hypothetical protein [Bacteroidota bacterium]
MYKLICPLLLLTAITSPFCSQNKVAQNSSSLPASDDGKPKIINPEGKTPFPYRHSVDQGLQDKSGNLWFGTSDGIFRYDGRSFTNYWVMDGLYTDHVTRILADKAGNIWFGAHGGIVRYDPEASALTGTLSFSSVKIQAGNGGFLTDNISNLDAPEIRNPITQMMEDRHGAIWFGAGYNVYRTDGRSGAAITTCVGDFLKREKVQYHCANPEDFSVCCMYEDKQGNILISTSACSCGPSVSYRLEGSRATHPCVLNSCNHDLHKPQEYAAHYKEIDASFSKITSEDGNTRIAFTTVLEDKAGTVWLGTDSGAYKYDGKHFTRFTKNDALSQSAVVAIYEDKKGNIWFATGEDVHFQGHGVFRYDPSASVKAGSPSISQFTTKDGLCSKAIFTNNIMTAISEDNAGRVWFAGYGGICYYDGKAFRNFTKADNFNEQPVNFILKEKTGSIWFGAWELGLYRYDGKSLTSFTENKPGL